MAAKKKEPEKEETIEDIIQDVYKEEQEPEKEPVKEEPPKETEPEVPLEEVTEEVEKKAKEEVKQDVLKALGVTKDEKIEAEEQGWESPWEKRGEGKPASWKEALDASADLSDFRRAQEVEKQKEEQKVVAKQKQEQQGNLNEFWDTQLNELRTLGKIPKVGDDIQKKLEAKETLTEEDSQDPGLVAQRELVETMYKVGAEREKVGKPIIYNLKEIYYEHYESKGNQPAGADAPVSGGTSAVVTGKDEPIDYDKDVHGTTFDELLSEK